MRWAQMTAEQRVRAGTRAILGLGFAAAVVIYLTAVPPPGNPLGYDPLTTKSYVHDLELFGGKANVLAAQFRDWFDSLWHGKQLAYTVAILTLLAAGTFKFFATPLPPELDESGGDPSKDLPVPPAPRLRVVHTAARKD